jgi:hypothetical protein
MHTGRSLVRFFAVERYGKWLVGTPTHFSAGERRTAEVGSPVHLAKGPLTPVSLALTSRNLRSAQEPASNISVQARHTLPGSTMRIAQIAPLAESVPPKLYGGTERVVHWLTEELVALGHEVTLFASADSVTRAELMPAIPKALRLARPKQDPSAACAALLAGCRGTGLAVRRNSFAHRMDPSSAAATIRCAISYDVACPARCARTRPSAQQVQKGAVRLNLE